jgi:hypothetical protein
MDIGITLYTTDEYRKSDVNPWKENINQNHQDDNSTILYLISTSMRKDPCYIVFLESPLKNIGHYF